jgi:hypothetical protein
MRLAEEVRKFSSACEHLLASAASSGRTLTADEAHVVKYYCNEVLAKVVPPSIANPRLNAETPVTNRHRRIKQPTRPMI